MIEVPPACGRRSGGLDLARSGSRSGGQAGGTGGLVVAVGACEDVDSVAVLPSVSGFAVRSPAWPPWDWSPAAMARAAAPRRVLRLRHGPTAGRYSASAVDPSAPGRGQRPPSAVHAPPSRRPCFAPARARSASPTSAARRRPRRGFLRWSRFFGPLAKVYSRAWRRHWDDDETTAAVHGELQETGGARGAARGPHGAGDRGQARGSSETRWARGSARRSTGWRMSSLAAEHRATPSTRRRSRTCTRRSAS